MVGSSLSSSDQPLTLPQCPTISIAGKTALTRRQSQGYADPPVLRWAKRAWRSQPPPQQGRHHHVGCTSLRSCRGALTIGTPRYLAAAGPPEIRTSACNRKGSLPCLEKSLPLPLLPGFSLRVLQQRRRRGREVGRVSRAGGSGSHLSLHTCRLVRRHGGGGGRVSCF
jgi:hypothetical protein